MMTTAIIMGVVVVMALIAVQLNFGNPVWENLKPGPFLQAANKEEVTVLSADGEQRIIEVMIPAGALLVGNVISFEGCGKIEDPEANAPLLTLRVKANGVTVWVESGAVGSVGWYLRGMLTVRSSGAEGELAAAVCLSHDNPGIAPFALGVKTDTVDMTVDVLVELTAEIQEYTGEEAFKAGMMVMEMQ